MRPARLSVLPPLPLAVYARRPAGLPFPLGQPACTLFARARHGLWHGVRALGLGPGDEVLVPAYHHGSEIEAFARAGITCRFYDVAEDLRPDPGELEALLGPRTRALHLIHYLGFPQDAPRWRAWCDGRGLLLSEDAAQAWLGSVGERPLGSFGDLAIFCLYKTFGLPDGAALLSSVPPAVGPRSAATGLGRLARRHARWLEARSAAFATIGAGLRRPRRYSPENDFALGDPDSAPSGATRLLLSRVADEAVAARRRDNYRFLLAELGDLAPAPFDALPDGAAPHAFPVETDDGATMLRRLADHGIRAFSFWTHHHPLLPATGFPNAAAWRARLVVLPVHQELRPEDLRRIAAVAREAQADAGGRPPPEARASSYTRS